MKTFTKTLAWLLCTVMWLSFAVSCQDRVIIDLPELSLPGRAQADSLLSRAENISTKKYSIVVEQSESPQYAECLEMLQSAIEKLYGKRLEVLTHSEGTVYEDAIFLGNTGASDESISKAYELSDNGGGFSAAAHGGCLAFYAHNHLLLKDVVELYTTKYLELENGSFMPGDGFQLARPYSLPENVDGNDYDFTLPIISVSTEDNKAVTSRTKYVNATVNISGTYSEFSMKGEKAGIRGRGNNSWKCDKKPYKLKFDEKVNLFGNASGNSREYALLSNPRDFTHLRNAVALTLGQKVFTKVGWTSSFSYVNLFLRGEYLGVYCVCEQVEARNFKIAVNEDPEDMTNSEYLIMLDQWATVYYKGNDEDDYFETQDKKWVIKSDYNNPERNAYVKSRIEAVFEALDGGDREQIEALVDLDSCIDMYLIHEYSKNSDVGWSSFYMVLRTDGKLYFVSPWDFDLSSGNNSHSSNANTLFAGRKVNSNSNPIFWKLMACPFAKELAAKRWFECRDKAVKVLSELEEQYIEPSRDEFIRDIATNYDPNDAYNRTKETLPEKLFEANLTLLKEWYAKRIVFLDSHFSKILEESGQ